MKTYSLIAAAALTIVASGAALAGDGIATYDYPQAAKSSVSRAEVRTQTLAAAARGELRALNGEGSNGTVATFAGSRSRAEVRAETLAAAARGELRALNGEASGYPVSSPMHVESTRLASAK